MEWNTTLWGSKESNGDNDILGGTAEIKGGGAKYKSREHSRKKLEDQVVSSGRV